MTFNTLHLLCYVYSDSSADTSWVFCANVIQHLELQSTQAPAASLSAAKDAICKDSCASVGLFSGAVTIFLLVLRGRIWIVIVEAKSEEGEGVRVG